ncbi:MAG TPA: metallophosphoesterase [Tepidisphaeraceae bacterium]|jgi:hypothetical protein|nr:metallophosphoesterase [Tepidisphaeraceae bacterium]
MDQWNLREAAALPVGGDGTAARVWVYSDIQQVDPDIAQAMMSAAVDDVLEVGGPLDAAWCLGDAQRGADEAALERVAAVFIQQMRRVDVPVCYLLGNHDMDLRRETGRNRYPLWERAIAERQWATQPRTDDLFFARRMGDYLVVFLGDHADSDGSWFTTHGGPKEAVAGAYPHTRATYERLRDAIAQYAGPVVIAAHYAFAGGQKPSPLLNQMLPLPANVKLVMHGHAHIGDLVWNKADPWERDHEVTGQALRQFNVSAIESLRSPGSHSAILELMPAGRWRLRIRDHQSKRWVGAYEG